MNLRISRGPDILSDIRLADGECVIGSGESADLRIESEYLAGESAGLIVFRRLNALQRPAIALWLQSNALVEGVAELGSFSALALKSTSGILPK